MSQPLVVMWTPIPPPASPPVSTQYLYPLADLSLSSNPGVIFGSSCPHCPHPIHPGLSFGLNLIPPFCPHSPLPLLRSQRSLPLLPPPPPSAPAGSPREPLVSTMALTRVAGGDPAPPPLSFRFSRSNGAPDSAVYQGQELLGGTTWGTTPSPVLPSNQTEPGRGVNTAREPHRYFLCVLHLMTSLLWASVQFSSL